MVHFGFRYIRLFISFARNCWGIANHPYATYRQLAVNEKESIFPQTVFIFSLTFFYFVFVSLIALGRNNPYLLTVKFGALFWGWLVGFWAVILLLYLFSKLLGQPAKLEKLVLLWSYTLIPTLFWFYATSFLYFILPPPRTMSLAGKLYSIIFITLSLALLLWKIILYYLTLRFFAKIDLWRIGFISLMLLPFLVIYSLLMYRLGIFRIPFI